MNILYHHRTQGRGAEGIHIMSIVHELEAMGHRVTIVSPPGIDPRSDAGRPPVDKSTVATRGIGSLWKAVSRRLPNLLFECAEIGYNLQAWRVLRRELGRRRYDLVYERYAFFLVAGAWLAARRGIPFVLEANEVSGIPNRARRQSMPRLCGRFERFLMRRCSAIHTVSSYLKDMILRQGVDEERIRVMPNAIDPERFRGEIDAAGLRAELGLEQRLVLGFAGWFDDWDRLDLLLDAFAPLAERDPRLRLMLIGDGAVLDGVRRQGERLGIADRVLLTGPVPRDQIQRYLSLLDIAVITHSNAFGSPVVMFEFMGLGIPIVAPRLLPITDVLTDGDNALLFDVLDMAGMRRAIETLIADAGRRRELAAAAYRLLMQRHTWRQNAEKILEDAGLARSDA